MPEDYIKVWQTDDTKDQCIGLQVRGVTHYIHSVTGAYLINMLRKVLTEWDIMARNQGAGGLLRKGESEDEFRDREIAYAKSFGLTLEFPNGGEIPDDWRFNPLE